ncbi:MAG: MATE family efflux transporter, partial [Fusobacteriaceae bacterium]|nr:MATE family efflux transporter [Fusobacteriaceae bacterium]
MRNKFKDLDWKFYRRLFVLTLPIVIQNLIASMLNMADTLMIGKLGEKELAAVGMANQYFFFFSLMLFGVNAGVSMFISQFWGKKDILSIKKMTSIGIVLGTTISIIFMVIGIIFPNQIIGIFNKDAQVVALGGRYLVVVALSYVFTAISFSFAFASRSIENSFLPMMASIVALLINIVGNYILIFGKFGVEAMGVEGAAWATVFARIIETIIIITYVYYKKMPIKVNLSNLLHIDTKFLNMSMKGITPILVNEIVWGLGNVTYNIIYSRLGVSAAATIQITTTVLNLLMIVIFALGSSAMIIVGQEIGRGDIARGRTYAKKLYKLALKVGIFVGIIVYFVAPYVVLFFNMSSAVLKSSEIILKINSIALMFRTYNFIMIVGILRGGGDAKFGLILQGITMWFIGIPLVY